MRVMVIIKATPRSEAGLLPSTELMAAMGQFNEALVQAGVLLAGEGLHPSARGKRLQVQDGRQTLVDGPFADTASLVAGFWLWQVASMDEAMDWVQRCPNPMEGDYQIEVRPLYEAADFGDAMTPELQAQEDRLRAAVQAR